MRTTIAKICFLILTALAISQTQALDLTYSGLYRILNCHAAWPARLHPEAIQLKKFLPEVWNANKLLLADITNGTNSKYGFEALFKTNDSITPVSSAIRGMRYGPDIGTTQQVATMVCLEETSDDPIFETLYKRYCSNNTVTVTVIPDSTYIGFCPSFFEVSRHGLDFPVSLDCPITKNNKIQEAPHPLMHNTYPIFLAQMLHLHMANGMIAGNPNDQVHHVQDCIDLNATASLENVANWANYAACRS